MLSSNSTVIYDVDGLSVSQNPGSTVPASALYIGGSDGTNLRAILTDASGRQVAVGAAATGGAPAGDPVYIAGIDGTNLRALLTDTSGRQVMVGAAADGAAPAGNPVLIAGQDGTNVQTLLTTATGALVTSTAPTVAGTAALTNVASSATSVTILAANANRLGAIIVNDGNKKLYLKFGTTASTTSYTTLLPAGGQYEVPFSYTGRIDGIWDSANGNARVTELTA